MCVSALAIVLCSTLQKIPPLDVTPGLVPDSLVSFLVQWVTMVILSGLVCRWSLNQLTASAIIHTLNDRWFLIFCICISVFSFGSSPFQSIKYDWGILFYFLLAQTMNTVRVAIQGMSSYYTNYEQLVCTMKIHDYMSIVVRVISLISFLQLLFYFIQRNHPMQ